MWKLTWKKSLLICFESCQVSVITLSGEAESNKDEYFTDGIAPK